VLIHPNPCQSLTGPGQSLLSVHQRLSVFVRMGNYGSLSEVLRGDEMNNEPMQNETTRAGLPR